MIIRLHHVGLVVKDLHKAAANYKRLFDMQCVDYRADHGEGFQIDARIMFPNHCWLHLIQNQDPESRELQFLQIHGENLEHIALETDDIESEVAHLQSIGVPIFQDQVFNTADGLHVYIYSDNAIGFTVELIQPHLDSLRFEPWKVTNANLKGLQHIGVAVKDIARATERFAALFSLKAVDLRTDQHYGTQKDMMIEPGNDRLWLHLVETTDPENRVTKFMQEHDAGLEHLCFEMGDIRQAVKQVQAAGVPLFQSKIYLDRDDGFEAFVYPQYNHGVTVELIEPYPDSRGYRQCP